MLDGATTELAELSEQYRGKSPGEQEYELALALSRIGDEDRIPDLGPKDYWLRVRDNLVRKIIEQRVAIGAVAVVAAEQVALFAGDGGLNFVLYRIPLAILTAMVSDAVIDAMGGDGHGGGSSSGQAPRAGDA
jgi:hypothetical protein